MSNKVTLGGDRLGSGNRQEIELKNYERSTHDLSYIWRSTMSAGTLVPFMSEVGLPGDTFDINLNVDIKTHPTIGPLFGSYKVQLDVFSCPVRLYNGKLHMNMLNIGLKMQEIKIPQIALYCKEDEYADYSDNSQINPSCIFSYLNIRGLGRAVQPSTDIYREFNALPYLSYWDIYKNYYANKQEEYGAVIHNPQNEYTNDILSFKMTTNGNTESLYDFNNQTPFEQTLNDTSYAIIEFTNTAEPNPEDIKINFDINNGPGGWVKLTDIYSEIEWQENHVRLVCRNVYEEKRNLLFTWEYFVFDGQITPAEDKINIELFPLDNIDNLRMQILQDVGNPNAFMINQSTIEPYNLPIKVGNTGRFSKVSTQEGLGLKTYQSDLFNNWIQTDWIEGPNGINNITAIDTSQDYFTIDTLQLSRKVYDMLNRIAVSGGTYDDWLNAVYTHERTRSIENPVYMGGLIRELGFQEVISNAGAVSENVEQPLGTLAGRGVLTQKKKGGDIVVKVNEPSYIMGIVSLTPRIDYSQGNKWDVNLKTMDDLHKPALDEIGFQDLITDQMAWWDTQTVYNNGVWNNVYKSAGKQPAWINYMTNVNVVRGNFADEAQQMFMTLNRKYSFGKIEGNTLPGIQDLTTYVDPRKFNNIFADTRLDAQNFWVQIGVNIEARRKMSARLMPNL